MSSKSMTVSKGSHVSISIPSKYTMVSQSPRKVSPSIVTSTSSADVEKQPAAVENAVQQSRSFSDVVSPEMQYMLGLTAMTVSSCIAAKRNGGFWAVFTSILACINLCGILYMFYCAHKDE